MDRSGLNPLPRGPRFSPWLLSVQGTDEFGRRDHRMAQPWSSRFGLEHTAPLPCSGHCSGSPGLSRFSRGFVNKPGEHNTAWAGPVFTWALGAHQISALLHLLLWWDHPFLNHRVLLPSSLGLATGQPQGSNPRTICTPSCCQDPLPAALSLREITNSFSPALISL